MGVLTGAIAALFKVMVSSKDSQIQDLKTEKLHVEETLTKDRDYWRAAAIELLKVPESDRV